MVLPATTAKMVVASTPTPVADESPPVPLGCVSPDPDPEVASEVGASPSNVGTSTVGGGVRGGGGGDRGW
jgi:hypothetical protein